MRYKNAILNILGILFMVWGILAITNAIVQAEENPASILWFCYLVLLIVGLGILFKNDAVLASQINIIAIPLSIWMADFFYLVITGTSLYGITDYFFTNWPFFSKIISLQHFSTIPLILFAIYLIKLKRKDYWKISFFEIIVVFVISRIITNPIDNINCVYKRCVPFSITPWYTLDWFIGIFIVILITNYILIKIPFFREKQVNNEKIK